MRVLFAPLKAFNCSDDNIHKFSIETHAERLNENTILHFFQCNGFITLPRSGIFLLDFAVKMDSTLSLVSPELGFLPGIDPIIHRYPRSSAQCPPVKSSNGFSPFAFLGFILISINTVMNIANNLSNNNNNRNNNNRDNNNNNLFNSNNVNEKRHTVDYFAPFLTTNFFPFYLAWKRKCCSRL